MSRNQSIDRFGGLALRSGQRKRAHRPWRRRPGCHPNAGRHGTAPDGNHGRPDGGRPKGFETYFDYLVSRALTVDEFTLTNEQRAEVDREFVQFYHRRVCWLKLQQFRRVVEDADHSLSLMDFCLRHSPDEQWTLSHEQHRPFVLFHRIQAAALAEVEEQGPAAAVHEVNHGLAATRTTVIGNRSARSLSKTTSWCNA